MDRRHFLIGLMVSAITVKADCVQDAAAYHHVPARLLRAMVLTDSAPSNAKGKGYQSLFKQAAAIYAPLTNQSEDDFAEALRRIASVESNFRDEVINGQVTSQTGAKGIMQIQPDVAKSMRVDPLDPQQAVFGAAYLLTERLQKTDGDLLRSIASYNGSFAHTRDGKWKPETKEYVEKIFGTGASTALMHGMRMDLKDECTRSYVGAWVLSKNIAKFGQTWRAVAARDHNKLTVAQETKRQAYIKKVWRIYRELPVDGSQTSAEKIELSSANQQVIQTVKQIRIGN